MINRSQYQFLSQNYYVTIQLILKMQASSEKNIQKQSLPNEEDCYSENISGVMIQNKKEFINQELNNLSISVNPSNSSMQPKIKERTRIKAQHWKCSQIKKIFKLYSEYGSQWKIMESQIVDRAANSIKNRFYTVIRTMLKLLFKYHPQIKERLPHQIPSKIILKFYEGRQEFNKYKGFGKRILKLIDYDLESKQLKKIVQENQAEIIALFELIFEIKCSSDDQSENCRKKEKKAPVQINYSNNKNYENVERGISLKSISVEQNKNKSDTYLWSGEQLDLNNNQNQMDGVGVIFFVPIKYFEPTTVQTYFQFL